MIPNILWTTWKRLRAAFSRCLARMFRIAPQPPRDDLSPQPLSRVCPNLDQIFLVSDTFDHVSPKLSALIMQVIATWSYVDMALMKLVTKFTEKDFQVVSEMLLALASSEARRAAIEAAAREALADDDFILFDAVFKSIKGPRNRRNEYTHHLWAHSPGLPDALMLIDPKLVVRDESEFRAAASEVVGAYVHFFRIAMEQDESFQPWATAEKLDRSKIFVYRENDIRADLKMARDSQLRVSRLLIALGGYSTSAKARSQLSSELLSPIDPPQKSKETIP